jgi:hypothetical protein
MYFHLLNSTIKQLRRKFDAPRWWHAIAETCSSQVYEIKEHWILCILLVNFHNNVLFNTKVLQKKTVTLFTVMNFKPFLFVSNDNQTFPCLLKQHACFTLHHLFHHLLSWQSHSFNLKRFKFFLNGCGTYVEIVLVCTWYCYNLGPSCSSVKGIGTRYILLTSWWSSFERMGGKECIDLMEKL